MAYSRPCSAYVADHSLPCEIIPESPLHAVDPLISSFRQMFCLRSLHQLSLIEYSWTSVSCSILGITDLLLSSVSMFQSIGSNEPQPEIFRLNWETVRTSDWNIEFKGNSSKCLSATWFTVLSFCPPSECRRRKAPSHRSPGKLVAPSRWTLTDFWVRSVRCRFDCSFANNRHVCGRLRSVCIDSCRKFWPSHSLAKVRTQLMRPGDWKRAVLIERAVLSKVTYRHIQSAMLRCFSFQHPCHPH